MRRGFLLSLALLTVAGPGFAQDPSADWDVTEDPERELIAASTTFSNGLSVALRCMAGRYDALIAGLPPAEDQESRALSIQFGDEAPRTRDWYVGSNPSVAISDLPARLARKLRNGGVVKVRLTEPGPEGRRLRYDLDLPTSNVQVDRTLEACGRPLVDARDDQIDDLGDDGLPLEFAWARPPRPQFPTGRTFERGFAVISCLSRPDGRMRDCVVESEHPMGGGFADAALTATERARVENKLQPDGPVPTRIITYTTRFRMGSAFDSTPLRSRIPRRE